MGQKHSTNFPGVRFREHKTRKHGVQKDRCYFIRYRVHGKLKEETVGWGTAGIKPRDCSDILSQLKRNQNTGNGPQTLAEMRKQAKAERQAQEQIKALKDAENITFGQVWPDYFKDTTNRGKTPKTLAREKGLWKNWIKHELEDKPLKAVLPLDIERILSRMRAKGLAPATTYNLIAVIRQVFNYADKHDFYNGPNPTRKIKIKRADNRRQRFLSQNEAQALLAECATRSKNLHDICFVSLHAGLRAGEIFKLTWSDINFATGAIQIRNPKNGQTRFAYMTNSLKDIFTERRKTADPNQPLVFPDRRGNKRVEISNSFDRAVNSLGLNAGLGKDRTQRVVFHTIRHTFASWHAMNGIPMHTLKELMGHKSLAMTERYSHLSPDHLQSAVKIFQKSLNNNLKLKA